MKIKCFDELTNREVYEILKARMDVFMIGQNIHVLAIPKRHGLGRRLMEEAERFARAQGKKKMLCSAQQKSAGFYEKCGYHRCSEEYEEAGIPHVRMEKEL